MSVFRTRRSSDWSLTGVGPLSGLSLFDHATRLVAEHGETAPSPASPALTRLATPAMQFPRQPATYCRNRDRAEAS